MKKIIVLLVFLFQSSFAYATPGYVFQTDYSTIYTDIKKVKFLANQDISQIGDFPIKYYNGRISQIGNNYVTYLNHKIYKIGQDRVSFNEFGNVVMIGNKYILEYFEGIKPFLFNEVMYNKTNICINLYDNGLFGFSTSEPISLPQTTENNSSSKPTASNLSKNDILDVVQNETSKFSGREKFAKAIYNVKNQSDFRRAIGEYIEKYCTIQDNKIKCQQY